MLDVQTLMFLPLHPYEQGLPLLRASCTEAESQTSQLRPTFRLWGILD